MNKVYLQKGKEKPVRLRHNWIFSGAIAKWDAGVVDGEIVSVHASDGSFLAYGYCNRKSKIQIRVLEWDEEKVIDAAWWTEKIGNAIQLRERYVPTRTTTARRLVFAEADGLPGLIVDQFGECLTMQIMTLGIEKQKSVIVQALKDLINPKGIYEKSDSPLRQLEGLEPISEIVSGAIPTEIEVEEYGTRFSVNIEDGQKSGFYADQRDNRQLALQFMKDKKVLDCFSYTGGFSVHALKSSATFVRAVDSSADALGRLTLNMELNQISSDKFEVVQADVFQYLRDQSYLDFDVVILDPPKLAPSRQSVPKAERAYKDLNMQALQKMGPGSILISFSCSGSIVLEHFKQILAWAATDAGKEIQFLQDLGQPMDHPVRAAFPESSYLKGVVAMVMN